MAIKNYMISDKWTDLNTLNNVDIISVDGVIDNIKINGEDLVVPSGKITITENGTNIDIAQYAKADVNVAGGGGSSDFSTAEVTVTVTSEDSTITLPIVMSSPQECLALQTLSSGTAHSGRVVNIALYKGTTITIPTVGGLGNLTVTGNAEISNGAVIITGDCAITINGGLS